MSYRSTEPSLALCRHPVARQGLRRIRRQSTQRNMLFPRQVSKRKSNLRHVHEKLYDEFPQLSDCGGYEVLCTNAGLRELMSIPTPPGGYTVAFLRNVLGQAKGYLRPIQKDLSVAVSEEKVTLMNYCLLLT